MLNTLYHMLDPVAFSIGVISVRWYGIAYLLGFACAGFLIYAYSKRWKLHFAAYDLLVFVCYCAFSLIIFARLIYCIVYGDGYYFKHPLEILALNRGGMSFHGGLIGAIIGGLLYARHFRVQFLTLADLVACVAPVGLFFGRCANFINGELYGAQTSSALGVDFLGNGTFYHPSQLYEAVLEGIVLFIILFVLSRKVPARPCGTFLGTFLIFYGVARFCLEFIRLPDSQIGYFFGTWGTMGQLLCTLMVIAGVCLLIYARKKNRPQKLFEYAAEEQQQCESEAEKQD
jgi:phosphatidylglycerol---prolipoprotein diacylglyceryl transferase